MSIKIMSHICYNTKIFLRVHKPTIYVCTKEFVIEPVDGLNLSRNMINFNL